MEKQESNPLTEKWKDVNPYDLIARINRDHARAFALVLDKPQMPTACQGCSNNPANGGSGVCLCTLGMMQVTC